MVFTTISLGFWLCGWAVGEVFAITEVLKGTSPAFLYFWLGGWTCGGAFALSGFLWSLLGRERVMATRDQLVLVYECGPWRRVQQFDPKEIRALRVVDPPSGFGNRRSLAVMPLWGDGNGPLTFDYGFRTVHLGEGVSSAEARVIESEIRQHAGILEGASIAPLETRVRRDIS
jgi:hypothetical protein